jgi:Raf kinase inhibitor-like YbhB/YbcL family protein
MKLALALCYVPLLAAACGGTPASNVASPSPRIPFVKVTSADLFSGVFPRDLTCDGVDRAPRLEWSGSPGSTRSYALEMVDPDAPGGTFVHWLVYELPGPIGGLSGRLPAGAIQGSNSFGTTDYRGPCPPPGGQHHYHVIVMALDADPKLPPGLHRDELDQRLAGHVVGRGELIAVYGR